VRLSYRWLGRHVDLSGISAEEAARELTLSTAEVESLERFAPQLERVTVGRVLERAKHPDADKLSVCQVDLGSGEPLSIVCGAPNVAAGQRVAVATQGTELPGGLVIKRSKIRGVESQGMICSERELLLSDEHTGIWVLPEDAPVGEPVASALGLEDWVIEVDNKSITHRPDLWGHRGFAAELAAIFRRDLGVLRAELPSPGRGERVPVRIESEACPRYMALAIEGVRAQTSPEWLRMLLLAAGQRPIDLLVDLSNFVMLDLGQPNHLFDRARISPEGIVVRQARPGESLRTLDGELRRLEPADLLICSGDEPVALAGVMGGEESRVEPGTRSLVLEVATFHPATVRRTSARLGLRTESSARFEKSLDPTLPPRAAAHFLALLRELQPEARLAAPPTDAGAWKDPSRALRLRGSRVRALLGADVPDGEIASILERLRFGVERREGELAVRVPSERATKDVTIEQDLVEEVGRIWRYSNVPERAMVAALAPPPRDERRALVRAIEDRLSGAARFHQCVSYSFVEDSLLAKLGELDAPHVQVVNPVAEGFSRVRRSVVPSLLALLEPNRRRRADVRLYEIGKGYVPRGPGEEPVELHELAIALAAPAGDGAAGFDAGAFARLQGAVEDLIRTLEVEPLRWRAPAPGETPSWAHPGHSVVGTFGEATEIGALLGRLEPGLERALGLAGELRSDVAVARISIDALLAAPRRPLIHRPLPRFPLVKVDVALALPETTPAAEALAAIERAGKGLVDSAELFDLYRGESLGPGRKSLAWHVVLRSDERTLGEEDVQRFLGRLEREAASLGGELRRE
jgi:phenylalanyl-tRNA synthetase beta chain